MRRVLPRLVLCILAFARTATAQIAMPDGIALSPFPVLQSPAAYVTFDDASGGIWAVFLGVQPGSGLYAQHVRFDGSYAQGFTEAARQYAKSGTLVNNFSAAPDGLGGAVVTWFGVNATDSTSQFVALRLKHLVSDGSVPGGIPDSGVVVSSIASAAMVVGDGQGGAYVVWEELKGPSNPDLFAQHYGASGAPLWTPAGSPTGRPVCVSVGIQRLRALHADGAGGAYVVWADSRVGTTVPLYAAHLNPAGVDGAPWTTNGVRVSPVTQGIRIVGSGVSPAGGLWVGWRDLNVAGQFNAQSLALDGSLQWSALGATVATTTPVRVDFVAASSGGVFVTWGGSDIRCSLLSTTGTRVWAEDAGRVLTALPLPSLVTRAVADGTGGQRLAWAQDIAGQDDVYALHVDGAGAPLAGEPPGGEVIETGPSMQEPVAWFDEITSAPIMAWLEDGQLRARRLVGANTGVEPPLTGPLALSPPSPNPSSGDLLRARFAAPPGDGVLSLYDLAGRLLRSERVSTTGTRQELAFHGMSALAPGVYTLRLEAAGFAASRRVVRVR